MGWTEGWDGMGWAMGDGRWASAFDTFPKRHALGRRRRWADGNAEGTVSDAGAPSLLIKSKKQQR